MPIPLCSCRSVCSTELSSDSSKVFESGDGGFGTVDARGRSAPILGEEETALSNEISVGDIECLGPVGRPCDEAREPVGSLVDAFKDRLEGLKWLHLMHLNSTRYE